MRSVARTTGIGRAVRWACVVCWTVAGSADAQVRQASLAEIRHLPIPHPVDRTVVYRNDPDHCVLLAWSAGHPDIDLIDVSSSPAVRNVRRLVSPVSFTDVIAAPSGPFPAPIFLLDRSRRSIAVIPALGTDTLRVMQTLTVPFDPTSFVAADFTGDGRLDLLLANRDVPGILPFVGTATGRLVERPVIAPDDPVGAFALVDLNGDGIEDLVLFDWVKNDLHLLYGVGRGRMIEQSVFPVRGDVTSIVPGHISPGLPLTMLLGMRNAPEAQVWTGNDFGEFSLAGTLAMTGRPIRLDFADVNGDRLADFVGLTDAGTLEILSYEYAAGFVSRVRFAVPDGTTSFAVSAGEDRSPSGIILMTPGASELAFYRTGSVTLQDVDSVDLAVGPQPVDVATSDLNRDGWADLVTVCARTQTLLISWGDGRGKWQGMTSVGIAISPEEFSVFSTSDSSARFLIGSGDARQVALVTFDPKDTSVAEAVIPTEGKPSFVDGRPGDTHPSDFGVLNRLTTEERNALSLFQDAGQSRYIERSFRLAPPNVLLGASIADVNADSLPDILYAYRPGDSAVVELGLALGDSALSMKTRAIIGDIPDSTATEASVWPLGSTGRMTRGLIVWRSGPPPQFWFVPAATDSTWKPAQPLRSAFQLPRAPRVRLGDIDGDGRADVIVGAPALGGVGVFRTDGDGFDEFRPLVTVAGLVNYDTGDMSHGGETDVVTVCRNPDRLRLYRGRWIREQLAHEGETR